MRDDEKRQKLLEMVARRLGAILLPEQKKEDAKTVLQTMESQRHVVWMKGNSRIWPSACQAGGR